MTALKDMADLDRRAIAEAVKWYRNHQVPERFRGVDPRILRRAARLAGYDWLRCTVEADKLSVTVWNHRVWTPKRR